MRIERHKSFLTTAECHALNEWVHKAVELKLMDEGRNRDGQSYAKRLTTRPCGDRIEYPELALEISNRIRQFCGVSAMPLIKDGHGRDGIVVSYTLPEGDVFAHIDGPRFSTKHSVLRCNVVTQAPDDGANLFVGGQLLSPEQGELHCYLASDHVHSVSKVLGDVPRILWMFGAHVLTEEWNSGTIKVGLQ